MLKNDYENKCKMLKKINKREKNQQKKYNNIGKKMKKSKREK